MPNIKSTLVKYLYSITLILTLAILVLASVGQIFSKQQQLNAAATAVLYQVEQILSENQTELEELKEEYRNTSLSSAETVAYMLQYHTTALESCDELKKIAKLTNVDEIHIFDKTGKIFAGTHPEYLGLTFDSGKQMNFFKPLLNDHSLKLCQDITPNTAENKLMQYSAVWSSDGEFIVQVGMEPVNVMKVTAKNELSYIFSLSKSNSDINLYALDKTSGRIMGATNTELVGKSPSDIGLDFKRIKKLSGGFYANVNGVLSYCVFKPSGQNIIGRVVSINAMFHDIIPNTIGLALSLLLITIILVHIVTWFINKLIITGINDVNKGLRAISENNLAKPIAVNTCLELSELSTHINDMVKSILAGTDKISYILNKSNIRIGVYEYIGNTKYVRFTEYIPKVLDLSEADTERLSSDSTLFFAYMDKLRTNTVPGEDGVFRVDSNKEIYVRLDELTDDNNILGIIIDVTKEIQNRSKLKAERDTDTLTGLLNRYGLENSMDELFRSPDRLVHAALIMIDADGLKIINDKFGHEKGDIYLKKISELIHSFGTHGCIASRLGGDEFVLFLYDYTSEDELLKSIEQLKFIQDNSTVHLAPDLCVPLRFSFGVSIFKAHDNYKLMLEEADGKMYESKRLRKNGFDTPSTPL